MMQVHAKKIIRAYASGISTKDISKLFFGSYSNEEIEVFMPKKAATKESEKEVTPEIPTTKSGPEPVTAGDSVAKKRVRKRVRVYV